MVAEHSSVRNDSDSDYEDDDDWDGMESTELDKAFSAATPLVDTLQFCDVLCFIFFQAFIFVATLSTTSQIGLHPTLKLMWAFCHGLASVKLIQLFLRTFPSCASIGETFFVTSGIVLYFGDMLLLTIKKGLVLGLLLYPIALKYILQICEWSINTTSAEARRYYEIGRSLIFVASLGIVLIVIVPSWMQFVHKFQMHPFLWHLINILI
ncbi:hypothetical protein JHK87_001726 [Glycine soja]|nr:hypothetical protein JHK87_001726 [Glycine soja]